MTCKREKIRKNQMEVKYKNVRDQQKHHTLLLVSCSKKNKRKKKKHTAGQIFFGFH